MKKIVLLFSLLFAMVANAEDTGKAYVFVDDASETVLRFGGWSSISLVSNQWTEVQTGYYDVFHEIDGWNTELNKVELNGKELDEWMPGRWSINLVDGDSLKITALYDQDTYPIHVIDPDGVVNCIKYRDFLLDNDDVIPAGGHVTVKLNYAYYYITYSINGGEEQTYKDGDDFDVIIRDTTTINFHGVAKPSRYFTIDIDNPKAVKVYCTMPQTGEYSEETRIKLDHAGLNDVTVAPIYDKLLIVPADANHYISDCTCNGNLADWGCGNWMTSILDSMKVVITTQVINHAGTLNDPIEVTDQILGGDVTSSVDNWNVEFTGTDTNGKLYRNTWANEGNEDYVCMAETFMENWVEPGKSLSDQFCRIDTVDVEPGAYKITARVRLTDEYGENIPTGGYLFGNFQRKAITSEPCYYNGWNCTFDPLAETYAVVGDDGKLTFGLQTLNANYNSQAYKDFHIYYLGKSDESVTTARNSEIIPMEISDDVLISKDYKENLNDYAFTYKTALNAEAIMTAASEYTALKQEANENMTAWKNLKELYDRVNDELASIDPKEVDEMVTSYQEWFYNLVDLMDEDKLLFEELTLSTQEVKDAYTTLEEQYYNRPIVPKPWYYLSNRKFEDGFTDWKHSGNGGQLVSQPENAIAEAWNVNSFDVYQYAQPGAPSGFWMPKGFYQLTMTGFYRYSRSDNAWMEYFNDDGTKKADPNDYIKTSPVEIYMNDFSKPLVNYFAYSSTPQYVDDNWLSHTYYTDPLGENCYPEAMTDISETFGREQYLNTVCCVIAHDNDSIRVGIKGCTNQTGDSWAVFSNFKVTFLGYDYQTGMRLLKEAYDKYEFTASAEALANMNALFEELEPKKSISDSDIPRIYDAIEALKNSATAIEDITATTGSQTSVEVYQLNGTRSTRLQRGINIIRTMDSNGNAVTRKVIVK